MIRWLAVVACVLTVCITGSSAFIRHAQAGVGCPTWPACERASTSAPAESAAPAVRAARALHRVSAMVVGVLVLLLAVFGWSSASAGTRAALAFALADTLFLAWLGRLTPHPIPLVTIGNLLGGLALAASFAWIAAARPRFAAARDASANAPRAAAAAPIVPVVLFALLLLAAAAWVGTMIGAHDAIGACTGGACAGDWRFDAAALDPLRAPGGLDAASARGLHWVHRAIGAAFVVAAFGVAVRVRAHGRTGLSTLLVAAALAQVALGAGTALGTDPLATATAHNLLAALLAAALAAIAGTFGGQRAAAALRTSAA